MTKKTTKIRLAVFDWAGTTIDFGSRAPAEAFARVFAARGVEATDAEARAPMGLNKREHLKSMLSAPPLAARWTSVYGRDWTEADVDSMYHEFAPYQLQAIEAHAELVPGLLETVQWLRAAGVRIGGTTGYFRSAAEAVARKAAEAGFVPDANACADDVPQGRPAPWMIHRVMERLGVYPPAAVVNVGDTVADVEAGLAAGCWSVGVCDSSSLTGLSLQDFRSLPPAEATALTERTAGVFREAGCHAVLRTISELPALIEDLERRSGPPGSID